jgi:hypothetical protein
MFTMKKFATLALTGFLAVSMLGCPDDKDDECEGAECDEQPPVVTPGGDWALTDINATTNWAKKVTIELGGDNSTLPSALDIDALATGSNATGYKISDGSAATNKQKIDLLFDGTNIFAPEGCGGAAAVAACPQSFKTAMSGYVGEGGYATELFAASANLNILPSMTTDQLYDAVYDANDNPKVSKTLSIPVAAKPAGVYYVVTALNNKALVLVGGGTYGAAGTTRTLTILIAFKQPG